MNEHATARSLKSVLCIGNACVDIVNVVDKFPEEDSEQVGLNCYWQRGGNATNNCTVLSLLNTPCQFMGVLPTSGLEASWLREDFKKSGIPIDLCVTLPGMCPVSTSILNTESGSRTILVFPRNFPELTLEQFKEKTKGDFSPYSWVHFELRQQTDDVVAMMRDVSVYNKRLRAEQAEARTTIPVIVSVEVENPSTQHPECAMTEADFIFISKDFAKSRSCQGIQQALQDLYVLCRPGSILICAWGDQGAGVRCNDDVLISPAIAGVKVVDSLGAGDTFTAGFIHSMLKQTTTSTSNSKLDCLPSSVMQKTALDFACRLAGFKCGVFGYSALKDCDFI